MTLTNDSRDPWHAHTYTHTHTHAHTHTCIHAGILYKGVREISDTNKFEAEVLAY